jgi:anti-sigma B factor antagonist
VLPGVDQERADMQSVGKNLVQSRLAPRIIVDLSCLEWISSTFLNELLQMRMIVHAAGRKLILCGLQPVVLEVFQISKLDGLFDFSRNTESALSSFS